MYSTGIQSGNEKTLKETFGADYWGSSTSIMYQKRRSGESEHSANKALILSAVLPGAGQVYNRQAWKIPIIYAAFGGVAYFTYNNYVNMKQFKDEYLYRVNHDGATQLEGYESYPISNIYNLYESYNQSFQLSIIIACAVYGLNLIDAYVFGHLFDFQITNDLSMSAMPTIGYQYINTTLKPITNIRLSFTF